VGPERLQRRREPGRRCGARQRGSEFLEAEGAIVIRPREPADPGLGGCMSNRGRVAVGCVLGLLAMGRLRAADDSGRDRLVAALLGPTPLADDLEALSDRVGGRPTGSDANRRAVDWAMARLADAGVTAVRERFAVGDQWLERSARAEVRGDGLSFAPRVAAMPFSISTPARGTPGPRRGARGRGTGDVQR